MRFITEDTNKGDVKDPLSLNLYTYCQGNPIKLVDIDGHAPTIHEFGTGKIPYFEGFLNTYNLQNTTEFDIVKNLPDSWTFTANNGHIHIRDAEGNIRIRIDPPDGKTNYDHVHLYDEKGNLLNKDLDVVNSKSEDGHQKYNGPKNRGGGFTIGDLGEDEIGRFKVDASGNKEYLFKYNSDGFLIPVFPGYNLSFPEFFPIRIPLPFSI